GVVARYGGRIALEYADYFEFEPLDGRVTAGLLRRFRRTLDDAGAQLGRGKGKPPSTISDDALEELYAVLRIAVKRLRPLIKAGKSAEAIAEILNAFPPPSPFGGPRERAALGQRLAQDAPDVWLAKLLAAAVSYF